MDTKPTPINEINVGDSVVINGRVCEVDKKLGPVHIRAKRFTRKGVALRKFDDKWYFVRGDSNITVDKVVIKGPDGIIYDGEAVVFDGETLVF